MAPPKLPTRQLGKNGPQVVELGFGLMGMSSFYAAKQSDEERFKVLDRAYELGALNWDSADAYGDSEELVGKWFKRTGKRAEIFLATKFGNHFGPDGQRSIRNSPEYVAEACARSLSRLGVECIDLYYCHRFNGEVPVETVVGAMAELVRAGRVRHLGLSEVSAATLRRAHAVHPIAAVQMEYSPFSTDIEAALLATCRELGVAVVAYSPLGRGFLAGTIRSPADFGEGDVRRLFPRFAPENFAQNLVLVDKLAALARAKGCTPAQLSLAWLLRQGPDVIPIPGTSRIAALEENMAAIRVSLSDEEEADIRRTVDAAGVHGDRYPGAMAKPLFADTPELK